MTRTLRTLVSRGLRSRPLRAALTLAGVSGCALLMLVALAARRSLEAAVRELGAHQGVDLWVAPPGSDNLIRSTGVLPSEVGEAVAALPGVAQADGLLRAFVGVVAESGHGRGRKATLLSGGPWARREADRLPQQHRAGQAEDRRASPDANSQHRRGGQRKARPGPQRPRGVAHVLEKGVHGRRRIQVPCQRSRTPTP